MGDILEGIGVLVLAAMLGAACACIVSFGIAAGVLIAMHIF